jgi:hypothetical protein
MPAAKNWVARAAGIILTLAIVVVAIVLAGRLTTPAKKTEIVIHRQPTGPRILYPAARLPALTLPDGERRTIYSVLNIRRPMQYGDYVWNEERVPPGPAWVRVDLSRQTISVFRGGHEIGSAVILYGTDGKPTPTGMFKILEKARDHHSSLYDAPMPFMMRLTMDGVAIHGSDVREGFGTHGCIGIPTDFASLLYAQVHRGDMVVILPATAPPGKSAVATRADIQG